MIQLNLELRNHPAQAVSPIADENGYRKKLFDVNGDPVPLFSPKEEKSVYLDGKLLALVTLKAPVRPRYIYHVSRDIEESVEAFVQRETGLETVVGTMPPSPEQDPPRENDDDDSDTQ